MSFTIGDYTFYPHQGIGQITNIAPYTIANKTELFYEINIVERDMMIKIPVQRAENLGLRKVLPPDQATKVFDILKLTTTQEASVNWNKRYRDYTQKLSSGSPFEIAEVLRDLIRLGQAKELSFGERRMLDQAKTHLLKELSFALDDTEANIEVEFARLFAQHQQKETTAV